MNMGCRSLILAVDNRASEIAKDTNLPVLPRGGEFGCAGGAHLLRMGDAN